MKDEKHWAYYDKYKSSYKKIEALRELKQTDSKETLDRICKELESTRSSSIKSELIDIIEYQEALNIENLLPLANYKKVLKKYKVNMMLNYWHSKTKLVEFDELENEINKFSNKFLSTQTPKRQATSLKIRITDKIFGLINANTDPRGEFYHQNLTYGFFSTYSDASSGYLNKMPYDQRHNQESYREMRGFNLFENLKESIYEYFTFLRTYEEKLLEINISSIDESETKMQIDNFFSFNKELWLILSLVNLNIANDKTEYVKEICKYGSKITDNKKAGFGWKKYFDGKINTGSNNR